MGNITVDRDLVRAVCRALNRGGRVISEDVVRERLAELGHGEQVTFDAQQMRVIALQMAHQAQTLAQSAHSTQKESDFAADTAPRFNIGDFTELFAPAGTCGFAPPPGQEHQADWLDFYCETCPSPEGADDEERERLWELEDETQWRSCDCPRSYHLFECEDGWCECTPRLTPFAAYAVFDALSYCDELGNSVIQFYGSDNLPGWEEGGDCLEVGVFANLPVEARTGTSRRWRELFVRHIYYLALDLLRGEKPQPRCRAEFEILKWALDEAAMRLDDNYSWYEGREDVPPPMRGDAAAVQGWRDQIGYQALDAGFIDDAEAEGYLPEDETPLSLWFSPSTEFRDREGALGPRTEAELSLSSVSDHQRTRRPNDNHQVSIEDITCETCGDSLWPATKPAIMCDCGNYLLRLHGLALESDPTKIAQTLRVALPTIHKDVGADQLAAIASPPLSIVSAEPSDPPTGDITPVDVVAVINAAAPPQHRALHVSRWDDSILVKVTPTMESGSDPG